MKYKIITSVDGVNLIEYVLKAGLHNNGFKSKEELLHYFPDPKLDITYTNEDRVTRLYAIKNIKTDKLLYNRIVSNPAHKYYENFGSCYNALKKYLTRYKFMLDKGKSKYTQKDICFLEDNPPEDLKVVSYYLVEKDAPTKVIE